MSLNIFKPIVNKIFSIFKKSKKFSEAAVKAVDILKTIVESGAYKAVSDYIPEGTAKTVLTAFNQLIPKAALELGIINDIVHTDDPHDLILKLVNVIKIKSKSDRADYYKNLAASIFRALEDGEISLNEAIEITQQVYDAIKSAKQ